MLSVHYFIFLGELEMDTKHLEYFRIVYEEKSIHAAAKKLFISPQGLGKIIQNLEVEFKTPLFTRTKNGVFPTESGTLFYEQCVKTCRELKLLQTRMERMKKEIRSLKIGFATGTLQLFPMDLLFQFIENHREIQIHWWEYSNQVLIRKILASEIDYGFVVGNAHNNDLTQKLRCVCPVVLLVYEGHPLYEEKVISLDMLRNENLILMNESFQIYHDFTAACRIHGFEPKVIAKTMDGGSLYRLCTEKIGLAVTPHFPLQNYLHVKAIPLAGDYTWEIYGSCRKDSDTGSELALLETYLDERLPADSLNP